uniref:C-type lectin domain-containing protein n=1 Tax=Sander lucioperca TaxID=283035 RepID=A0A8C9Y7P8_SANLU
MYLCLSLHQPGEFLCTCVDLCYLLTMINVPFFTAGNLSDLASTSFGRYFFIDQAMTWDNARAYCRTYHTDLASVRNKTENAMIQEAVGENRVWIGLHRYTWRWWSDGTYHSFGYWADGHPVNITESCAATVINATHLGKWVENNCNEKLHFMCQNSE